MINVLLIFKNDPNPKTSVQDAVIRILQGYYQDDAKMSSMPTLAEAVSFLQKKPDLFELILLENADPSFVEVKKLIDLCPKAKFILFHQQAKDISMIQLNHFVDQALLGSLDQDIPKVLKKFEVLGHLAAPKSAELEYVPVKPDTLASFCPLNSDVYLKMSDGRFVKLFRKGDPIERADFDRYQNQKHTDSFYFKKAEYEEILRNQVKRLEKAVLDKQLTVETAHREAVQAQNIVRDLVREMGFTPEAQMIAKCSVAMTVKVLASKPKLAHILSDLKKKEGGYVSSHSVSLGTLACAIAHKMEWNSAATYFKLSLAAFMHDIALDDRLAKVHSLRDASMSNLYSPEELTKIKLHPIHAGDYVRKMSEIPADVDQIVMQHHERPDGTGFPRGLNSKFVSPLGALFIIAHELLDYIREDDTHTAQQFFETNDAVFKNGPFRKIWTVMQQDLGIKSI